MATDTQPAEAPKPWYQSKTIWVNIALAGAAWALENTGVIQGVVGEHWYEVVITAIALANLVLRKLTTGPVYIRKPGDTEPRP